MRVNTPPLLPQIKAVNQFGTQIEGLEGTQGSRSIQETHNTPKVRNMSFGAGQMGT